MFTSAVLALMLTVVSQKTTAIKAPPERPIFGFPSEDANPALPSTSSANSTPEAGGGCPKSFHNDARLNDIFFIDGQCGWAVGEHGTIWHTEDGGGQWRLQPCDINCTLQSVCFITRKIGWTAGGYVRPYSRTGRGVILSTIDGGQTWRFNPLLLLNSIKRIGFTDPKHGWAIGLPSAIYPSGIFTSEDGGRSWNPVPGKGRSTWLSGDFLSPTTGASAGLYATAAAIKNGEIESVQIENVLLQSFHQLRLVPPAYGWLAGDGGSIMLTVNGGGAWRVPAGNFPLKTAKHFDFAALAARGPKAWIAGAPGSRVFYTSDAGSSWSSFPTGISTPLRSMNFVDDLHGWAAGALGIVLATSDGGRTWQKQRSGGEQAALLALVAQPDDVPLELLAKMSGNDGYLSAVEVVARRDIEVRPKEDVPASECLNQAVAGVGGSYAQVAWQFPLREAGFQLSDKDFLKGWDMVHNGQGMEALEDHLVEQIRIWRPDVVFTNNIGLANKGQLEQLIGKAVLKAIDLAADPKNYSAQISEAGLTPWQVKKAYAAMESGAKGAVDITTSQFAPRLGRSLADASAEPRGLISDGFSFPAATMKYGPLADYTDENQRKRDLTDGVMFSPQCKARRQLDNAALGNVDLLQQIAIKQRNTQAILDLARRNPEAEIKLLAQNGELIRGLDDGNAGRVLYYLGDRYYHTGQWPLAAETFQLLAERYPQHPLTRQALTWLVQYYASGESAWRGEVEARSAIAPSTVGREIESDNALALTLSQRERGQALSQRETQLNNENDRLARAIALGKQIERANPELSAEPAIRLPLEAARQKQGGPRPADPSRPTQRCWRTEEKPKLDGLLDDAIWQKIETEPLKSALKDDDGWPAVVAFAYDADFLYVAIHCRRAPGVIYEPAKTPRKRDADLSDQDRVDVFIDIDCDFTTYYRFSVDYRGFTAESCWDDSSWNPTWYVASNLADDTWTIEAAIPLEQIAGRRPKPRERWAVGVERTVPGVGFQSWSVPASTEVRPEGFGYLIFQ